MADVHMTVLQVDASQALSAEAKLLAAEKARTEAAQDLARIQEAREREYIAVLRGSTDHVKRAAAVHREAAQEARAQMTAARDLARSAQQQMREEAAAAKRLANDRRDAERAIADVIKAGQAEQRESIALLKKEQDEIKRLAAERDAAYSRAERGAATYTAVLNKQRAAQEAAGRAATAVGTGLRVGGAIGAGVGLGIAGIRAGVGLTNELVEESYQAQATARNLQIDIRAARDELGGLVSDFDLAGSANKAFAMNVAGSGEEFAHLAGMVAQQATKMGIDQTQAINDAIEAIGKQEAEMADNIGLTLRLTDSYDIFAKSIGKVASELTKEEKAQAYKTAFVLELERVTGRATVKVDGFARSWKDLTVNYKNFRAEVMGFDDTAGRANEALRELSDEQLDRLKFADALNDEDAKRLDSMGTTAREMQGYIDDWGLSIMDLKKHADTLGVSYTQMLDDAKAAHAALFEQDKRTKLEEGQQETLTLMEAEADALEDTADLFKIMGAKEKELLELEIQQLEVRRNIALTQADLTGSAEDEAKAKRITAQIDQAYAKIEMIGKKKGGKKKDPNEALDLETAATLRLLESRQKIYEAELDGERDLAAVARTREYLLTLERQELDVREEAANQRKVRKPEEIAKRDAELLDIMTERRLLDIEATGLQRSEEQRLAEERLSAMDREIARYEAVGIATGILKKRREDAHLAFVSQYGTEQEVLDAVAENTLADLERRESWRVDTAEKELAAFEREVDLVKAKGRVYYDEADARLALQVKIADAEGNDDKRRQLYHQREVLRIEERRAKFARAQQATNSLIGASVGLAETVANATMKNEAKREKFVLRVRGVEAVARGAAETVEAAAAYASFNIPQGILHTIAAATAFATGIPMIAGVVPSGGAAASATGSGGGADHQTVVTDSGSGGSRRETPTVPPSAEELIRLRGGSSTATQTTQGKGGNVYNIGTIVAGDAGTLLHDLDDQTAKKWGAA